MEVRMKVDVRSLVCACALAATVSCQGSSEPPSTNTAASKAAPSQGEPAWHCENPLPQGNYLTAIWGNGTGDLYAAGFEGTILHSGDGGDTWTIQKSGTKEIIHAV